MKLEYSVPNTGLIYISPTMRAELRSGVVEWIWEDPYAGRAPTAVEKVMVLELVRIRAELEARSNLLPCIL